ncbi:uncharacterized protein LOC143910784 [Arctopsyche grandis]|uniref:uncharacterized protein LOC143910784 n=1 Tax=Arctopsyche grandis TaxID=121162 RepID=UPI00406D8145
MDLTLRDLLIFCGGFLIALYFYGTRTYNHFRNKGIKYIKPPLPFFGSTIGIFFRQEHFKDFTLRCYNMCKDDKYIGLFEVQRPLIIVKDIEILKSVGIKDFDSFHNHRVIVTEEIDPLFGNALVSLKDEKWRDMRATLSPAFTSSKMKTMITLVEEIAKEFANFYVEKANNEVDKTVEIEAKESLTRYTNDVIATSAFGIKINSLRNEDHEFYKLGKVASDFSGWLMIKFALLAFFPRLTKLFNFTFFPPRVVSFFRNIVQCTMESREKNKIVRHDMINILMEAKKGSLKHEENDETDAGFATVEESSIGKKIVTKKWTDDELTAQAMIFFLGGFETTSTLILFFFYEMARNPDIQKKVQEEIDSFIKQCGECVVYTDLKKLKYLDMAISETRRMWPPGLMTDRVCSKDYTLPPANENGGQSYQIKKGEAVWIPIYGLHHDPKYFPDPNRFDPERFSDDNKSSINPMSYLPFGIGPRNCIGSRFALLVAKLIAFHTLAKFDIVVTKNTQIPVKLSMKSLNLKTERGMYVGLNMFKIRNLKCKIMAITFIDVGIFAAAFLLALYYYGVKFYDHFKNTDVKYTKPPIPFIGSMWKLILRKEDMYSFFKRTYEEYPDERYIGLFDSWRPFVMIRDLELLKQVGIKEFDTFHDHRNFASGNADDLFSSNLFVMEGDRWKEMRAALSPAFTSSKMRNMFVFIEECARDIVDYYINHEEIKEKGIVEIDVKDSITRYTNDVIATSAFGIQVNSIRDRDNDFYRLGRLGSDFSGVQLLKFFGYSMFPKLMKLLNIPFTRPVVSTFFKNLVKDAIQNREDSGIIRHDMINLLMEAKKGTLVHDSGKESSDTGFATVQESSIGQQKVVRKWNDTELAAQAFLFFIAGFETSATLITFFFYEMVRNPDIQKRLQEEIDDHVLKSEGKITYNDVQKLKYLDMTISETLRMWPPVGATDRACTKSYTLPPPNKNSNKSYTVKANQIVWIPIYGLLHDSKYFPDPERFDPERFSDENKALIDPITYLPFGVGPRNCIGSRFALMEIKLIAFHLLSKFNIVPTKNTHIPIEIDRGALTLKIKKGLFFGLKLRKIK